MATTQVTAQAGTHRSHAERPYISVVLGGRLLNKRVFYGLGYGFLVSQWLSNGTFGSTWLASHQDLGLPGMAGQLLVYVVYLGLVVAIALSWKRVAPLIEKRWVITFATAGVFFGFLLSALAELGLAWGWVYSLGMACIGAGMSVLCLAWGEYYCAIGTRDTATAIVGCYAGGAVLFLLLCAISKASVVLAIAIQLCLIPLSQLMLARGAAHIADNDLAKGDDSFAFKPLLPYLACVVAFGFALGVLIGFGWAGASSSSPVVWGLGMCVAAGIVYALVLSRKNLDLVRFSRIVPFALIIFLLLIPLFWQNAFVAACTMVCMAYVCARIFYQTLYVSIAQKSRVPLLPLIAAATSADSIGVVAGEAFSGGAVAIGLTSFGSMYLMVLAAASVILILSLTFLSERRVSSLWGFDPPANPYTAVPVDIESLCARIAGDHGLTARETQILLAMAQGAGAQSVADDMCVSLTTIRSHIRNMYKKLGIHSQNELTRILVEGMQEPLQTAQVKARK